MKRKLEISELIFKVISYVLLTVFALCCLYPFLYAVSASISRKEYVEYSMIRRYEDVKEFDTEGNPVVPEDSGKTLEYVPVQKTDENGAPMVDAAGNPVYEVDADGNQVTVPKLVYSERAQLILFPKEVQFDAFAWMFGQDVFWNAYSNTLFLTVYGTVWSLVVAVLGAYALSKKRLLFRKFFNFFLVFTMWFSAGIVPQYLNYIATKGVFNGMGITDDKWLVVIAMGMAAMNIILLRNTFENVPSEIEEAAIVDGASEFQVLRQVFIPMSKSTIATVALFFAVSRWNGYFWARQMISNPNEQPLQVYIRNKLEELTLSENLSAWDKPYAADSVIYALIVCSIIPILVIYPFIQKYFAKGTNAGGVKE